FDLLAMDIEYRVKAGLPALLAERYFEHPRLQKEDARLDAEKQVELIRWEYQQRWNKGERARRAEYQAAFPQHADALRELKPTSRCPRCRKMVVLDEAHQIRHCPDCDGASRSIDAASPTEFDSRGYPLNEQLGKGGMGEVYRSCDPALGRDLAIKVMKANLRGYPEAERRFLREARITGSLQHPSIVPIHNLGRLADGRLHYTMRLVRGQTFADILKDEGGKPERLPYLLSIYEKMCQAVAYAHSKRVIHRDLKPANVMVGKFGEVQVMDLGLAKVLTIGADAEPRAPSDEVGTVIHTESVDTPSDLSRAGSGMGTAAYMPPEQALGEWDTVDERADVFALGSILCEMLTGQPAYSGTDGKEVFRRAKRGDLTEAGERLRQCPADATLIALCRECLSPERDGRPRDASVVAERVKDYQAAVQERLRQAELERVAAETRAREEQARALVERERAREALARVKAERRARRRTLALAAAVVVFLVSVGGAWWWKLLKQDQADREALSGLERGRERLEEGWRTNNVPKLTEAIAEAERAAAIARNGGASDAVTRQVAALQTEAQERLDRAKDNQKLLDALVDIAMPQETKSYKADASGGMMLELAEPSVEEQYVAAFRRRWPDVDVEKDAASAVVARLQEEPEAVVQGVIAGLDGWMVERRRQKRPEAEWRRLLAMVEQLDQSEPRRQLRALLIGASTPSAESVVGLLGGTPPWPALWYLAVGNDWRLLRRLRGQMDMAGEPVLAVLLLAQASSSVGDLAGAEEVLRLALARRPDDVSLLDALGKVLERQARLADAIGCYRAARAKNPGLGIDLGWALGQAGQAAEGVAVLRDLVRQQPYYAQAYITLGAVLNDHQGKPVEAEAAFRKAIALKPDDAYAHYNLGVALSAQGKPAEAEAARRKAIVLKPDFAKAYYGLGIDLKAQGKHAEAEAAYRKAIALKPDYAEAYNNLGAILNDHQGKPVEAEAAFRKAIALKPDDAYAHYNLGVALSAQGKPAEAEAARRKAIVLKPDFAKAYYGLGIDLKAQGKHAEAEAAYRKAIALKPDYANAYNNLGAILNDHQGKPVEAEAAFRKAIALKPDYANAYVGLGNALNAQGKPVEAEAAYRKAIALKPDYAEAYVNLGWALHNKGQVEEAISEYRKAIALDPKNAWAHNLLGWALYNKGQVEEAISEYRKAIALDPKNAWAHNYLGWALYNKGQVEEAISEYRKAIALDPKNAWAHCNIGAVLCSKGHFNESLKAYQRGHELGSKQPGWRYPSLQCVRYAERMVALEKKLPAVLQCEASPANADDVTTLAWMCRQSYQKRYAASARLYAGAFSSEPKLAADLDAWHRYSAACSAALAAAGQGEDARLLPDKTVAMFRRWALGWLRDDLT
ncbi:MAG: tetratricopeptide repeat protein, partial [Gemmataceae bacterium]